MKINLDNYEAWALDYLEGNLSDHQRQMFEGFLEDHPELMAEMEGMDQIRLDPDETMVYPDKSALYKTHRATILPWFGLHYPVAAAVAFLLLLGAGYFIWEGSLLPTSTLVPDMTEYTTPVIQPEGSIAGTEELASDHQGAEVHEHQDTPDVQNNSVDVKSESKPKGIDNHYTGHQKHIHELQQVAITRPEKKEKYEDVEKVPPILPVAVSEVETPDLDHLNRMDQAVAMLPPQEGMVTSPARAAMVLDPASDSPASREFKVHIPGEFLSETWSNINVASLKEKVIPSFISKKLNL